LNAFRKLWYQHVDHMRNVVSAGKGSFVLTSQVNSNLVGILLRLPEVGSRYQPPVSLGQRYTFSAERQQQQQQHLLANSRGRAGADNSRFRTRYR
jgi:hypothetical protein